MKERDEETFVRELLEGAGKRPVAPAEPIAEIVAATRQVWQKRYGRRRQLRRAAWLLPIAATLIAGFVIFWWSARPKPLSLPPLVAAVVRVTGAVPSSLVAGQRLRAGASVEVPIGGAVALRLSGGQSLRVHGSTRINLTSATLATLDFGSVYLDCPVPSDDVAIRTVAGDFRPVGTQFEVRAERGGTTELRVREGMVTLMRPGQQLTARAGQELIVNRDGSVRRGEVTPYADTWSWAEETAPMPEIEGRALRSFLEWVVREKGWALRFADDRAASLSTTVVLHGSVADLTPDQALQTIAVSSGFTYRVSDGTLTVAVPQ